LSGAEVLHRVTAGTFAADWVEGTATGYARQPGTSTYHSRRHPDVPWAFAGSNLNAVMLGQGGTIWRMADAAPPDEQRWQKVAIDPSVLAARVAGISEGILLFDDTGSEFTHDGERYTSKPFPNRYVHSRDSGPKTAPYLTVYLGEADHEPPGAPAELRAEP